MSSRLTPEIIGAWRQLRVILDTKTVGFSRAEFRTLAQLEQVVENFIMGSKSDESSQEDKSAPSKDV